jgi:superfamily I DNA and RNA helicase
MYDFVLVDEGQDFPVSFLKLATRLAKENRMVFAYDDLQTIFQASPPTPSQIYGADQNDNPVTELTEDTILYKCYRNPREILVCAHALGFGIYGTRIVQMLENQAHWEDLGYKIVQGAFEENSQIIIERPRENSLAIISNAHQISEIVQTAIYNSFPEEIDGVVQRILSDVADGLRPEDILVVVVDDRNARLYLEQISEGLANHNIKSNNIHVDSFGVRDFIRDDHVTLSTVHKAKGNESFMVYVVGVDALFSAYVGPKERNTLFTAMTRAKGWVRVSGIGDSAQVVKDEIDTAIQNFPYMRFQYPSSEQLKVMKRDLAQKDIQKQKIARLIDQASEEWTPEEIARYLQQKNYKKK